MMKNGNVMGFYGHQIFHHKGLYPYLICWEFLRQTLGVKKHTHTKKNMYNTLRNMATLAILTFSPYLPTTLAQPHVMVWYKFDQRTTKAVIMATQSRGGQDSSTLWS